MTSLLTREGLRFLFQREAGTIDRKTWWLGMILLASILLVLSLGWLALRPWAGRGLNERAMLDPLTMVAYVYAILFAFSVIFIAVSYVNLSTKRFRARAFKGAWPMGLSGLPLVALLVAGATQWLAWRVPETIPPWSALTLMAICAALFVWHVLELGMRPDISR